MLQYLWTDQSKQDLIQIRRFTVERWGYKQSTQYLSDLRKTLLLLAEMPLMGKDCLDDLEENIFRFPFGSHIICYWAISDKAIVVVAILHQSMVPAKHWSRRL